MMKAGREKFGAFVRREREAKEIGLREMAKKIGVSPTYLSKVERDEFAPPAEDKVRKIAAIIGAKKKLAWMLVQSAENSAIAQNCRRVKPCVGQDECAPSIVASRKIQLNTCGRANKCMVDAPRDRASRITAIGKLAPRRRLKRNVRAKVAAIMTAVNKTTPFSPN